MQGGALYTEIHRLECIFVFGASQNGYKKINKRDSRATNRLLGFSNVEQLLTGQHLENKRNYGTEIKVLKTWRFQTRSTLLCEGGAQQYKRTNLVRKNIQVNESGLCEQRNVRV